MDKVNVFKWKESADTLRDLMFSKSLIKTFMKYVEAPWMRGPLGNCPACPVL